MNKQHWVYCALLVLSGIYCGCTGKQQPGKNAGIIYPYGFDSLSFPKGNELTPARLALGKKIFFDTQFSADKKIACATCHKPQFAFADTVALHKGAHDSVSVRNTPSLVNIGYHPYFDYDGGVPTLEMQVLVPFDGETEMHSNLLTAAALMQTDCTYVQLAREAYGRQPDPYVITRALGAYQRSLVSAGSRYDVYARSKGKKGLSPLEIQGRNLFFSARTQCSTCHSGFLFTNFKFENIGVSAPGSDSGRIRVTIDAADWGKFKTPGLRNVAKTAPYMHNGSLKTLDEVIDFYNRGGNYTRNKSPLVKPLGLTITEKQALAAFLKTLNDTI